ncbi:MAG: hypothetical protein U1F83_05975 [Verrucomicrobiota bacterium]
MIVAALLAIPVGYVCYYGVSRLSVKNQIAKKIDGLRKQGLPVTTRELNQWQSDAAAISNAATVLTNAFAHLLIGNTNSALLPILGKGKLPSTDQPLPEDMKQAIAENVASNLLAMELVREGLTNASCRYPMDLEPGLAALLPHLSKLTATSKALALKALLQIENGEGDATVNTILEMLALADTIRDEPLLISHLVRISAYRTAVTCLERLLARCHLDDQQLRRLADAFQKLETNNNLSGPIAGELCAGEKLFKGAFKDM